MRKKLGEDEIHKFEFQPPPLPEKLGLGLGQDEHLNLPIIRTVVPGSAAHRCLPPGFRRNFLLIAIN